MKLFTEERVKKDSGRMECPKCKSYDTYAVLTSAWEHFCRECGASIYREESKSRAVDVISKELSKKFKRMKKQGEGKKEYIRGEPETAEEKVFLKLPADTIYLSLIRKLIVEIAGRVGFPEDGVAKIEMAVDEACTNVINHSYIEEKDIELHGTYHSRRQEDNIERPIDLRVHIDSHKILVAIVDRGKRLDLQSAEVPNLDEYLASTKIGALAVYAIKTLMDEVSYSPKPGVGNILRMVKYLPGNKEEVGCGRGSEMSQVRQGSLHGMP